MKNITINRKTLISELLKTKKDAVIAELINLNANFSKLKNPVLRGLVSGMVTIEVACKVAKCRIPDFMNAMKKVGFDVEEAISTEPNLVDTGEALDRSNVIELDVRPNLARQEDPLKIIMEAVKTLSETQCLKLIAPFEPVPLIHLLRNKGFRHEVEKKQDGSVITFFKKDNSLPGIQSEEKPVVNDSSKFNTIVKQYEGRLKTLDVRNLEMPKPMIAIMEALPLLDQQEALFVYHKKIPVYLLPHLQEKGYEYLTETTEDGKVNLLIYKP